MRFYLGTHRPEWLPYANVPLFVSHRRLALRKSMPRAAARWALDSGGFTELNMHGKWVTSPAEYVAAVRRYKDEIGLLDFAAPQDWMCEPVVLKETGLVVLDHQARTVANYQELRALAPDLPWIPVLQGWKIEDYLRCLEMYDRAGVDLRGMRTVGVGTVCRRQSGKEGADIIRRLAAEGLHIHGFGFKLTGVREVGHLLASADSLAWSYGARREPPLPGCVGHKNCANCLKYALKWREKFRPYMEEEDLTIASEAQEFLTRHFGPLDEGMTVEVRAFHAQSRSRSQTWHADFAGAVEMAFGLSPDHDVYFAVNPRWAGKGTKDGVARIICLHADFDYKVFDSREAAVKALVEFEVEPSAVVDSGGGLHVYWRLATPVANEPSLVNYVEHMMRRLYYRLAPGDDSLDGVQDISRILRVPGTVNHKPAYGGNYAARVLYQSDVAYDLDTFDKVLPLLPEKVPVGVANARGGPGNWTAEDVGAMLAHIDPDLPYNEWVSVLMGVHSAFPDQEGFDLCDGWSTAAREASGQRSLQNQPEKWWGFRRGEGQTRATLGTVVKLAMDGGWSPPKGPNMVLRVPSAPSETRAPEWQQLLSAYPALARDEMPHMLQRLVRYLEPMTINWQEDWAEMLALTGFSLLFPDARFENLGVNLWWLGVAPQGSGKSRSTEEVYKLCRAVSVEGEFGVKVATSATPEGYGVALNGQAVALLSYHSEYSGFLASLKREHMKGGKEMLCDLYDGRDWIYQKSTETIEAINPFLVVMATTTGGAVVENGDRKDLQNGYLSRFMFCVPDTYDRDLGVRSDLERVEMTGELLDHALRLRGVTRARFDMPFGQDPPCLTALKRDLGVNSGRVRTFEDDLTTEDLPAGRLLARVKKVAALLEMCESGPGLEQDDTCLLVREVNAEKAIRLVMRGSAYGHRLTRALGNSKDDDTATRVKRCLEKLPRAQVGFGLSMREVMQKTHMNKGQAQTALDILVTNSEVEKWEAGKKVMYKLVRG